jgi:Effector Associated Constant Component 1
MAGRTPEHEEEIAAMWAAFDAREEERWRQKRGDTKLQVSLIGASDDAPRFSPGYQAELHRFIEEVRTGGEIQSFGMALDAVDAQGGTIGEFLIELAQTGVPAALAVAIAAWLRAHYGRRVKVRFRKDRVEEINAGTPDEIGEVLKHVANFLDRDNKPGEGV